MRKFQYFVLAALLLACLAPVQGQVSATLRAGAGLPPGQTVAPNTPGGGVVVGNNFYASDAVNGFRHYKPSDPSNPDPINTGALVFDPDFSRSVGGTSLCIFSATSARSPMTATRPST